MRKLVLTLCLFHALPAAQGQDPHFSQFFASPLTMNPASTGRFDGSLRAAANYRNQWPGFGDAFVTKTVSIDGPVRLSLVPESHRLSLGMVLYADQTGGGIIKENHGIVSVSYALPLDEASHHLLSAGFGGGFGNYRFDIARADFLDELSVSGFTLATSELLVTRDLNRSLFDMHAGIQYQGTAGTATTYYVGASAFHLNSPRLGFSSDEYRLRPRYNAQAGGLHMLSDFTTLHLSMQWQSQFKYREWSIGGAASHMILDKTRHYIELYVGAWYRSDVSLIPYVGLEYNGVRAGFTYDFNASGRNAAASERRSTEFSLAWVARRLTRDNRFRCPMF